MKNNAILLICRILIISVLSLSFQSARAGMIGADQVVSAATGNNDREAVLRIMSRSEVSSQLQAMGIDPQTAKDRVAAMTDEEAHSLAGKLNSLPAGASSDWAWVLVVILIAAGIYYYWGWKK